MINEGNKRIYVTMSEDILALLEEIAFSFGRTKSQILSELVIKEYSYLTGMEEEAIRNG